MATPLPPLDPARAGEDKGPTIIAADSAIVAISTLFIIARLWVRVKVMRKFELDDLLVVISDVSGNLTNDHNCGAAMKCS
jgi:hypothetical protein